MQHATPPEPPPTENGETDPLARFRSWRGFLVAAIAVNVLFVYTMLGHSDPGAAVWGKVLVWFPFNAIATAVYLAIMARLARDGGLFYSVLCTGLIIANWAVMIAI
jgi:hypothetical protein